jgi:hypothetical protein
MKRRRFRSRTGYKVYVVLLSPGIMTLAGVRRLNPTALPEKPAIYVGMTHLTPEERFEKHKAGHKASRWVRDYGLRLLPKMYEHLNPIPTWEKALELEAWLAEAYRKQGYTVLGGH